MGGIAGVGFARLLLGWPLADPSVQYAVTVPRQDGTGAALAAEGFTAALLMGVVLWTSNRPRFAPYTSYCVGVLITAYIVLFAPISGFSINPGRTVGSAVFAGIWASGWLYFIAPVLGMLAARRKLYLRSYGADRILCAKLHPSPWHGLPVLCRFSSHLHPHVSTLQ